MSLRFPDTRGYDSILAILEDAARRRPTEVAMALAADAGLEQEWSGAGGPPPVPDRCLAAAGDGPRARATGC